MSTPTEYAVPSLARFYEDGLQSVPKPCDLCAICLGSYEIENDAVSIHPCKHIFHRECIVAWGKSQLLDRDNTSNDVKHGTCPYCRTQLFNAIGADAYHISAHTWAQTLYGLKGSKFEAIGRVALRRIRDEGKGALSPELVERIVRGMVQQEPEYEKVASELGVLRPPGLSLPVHLALQQYEVDIGTADWGLVNWAIRGDLSSLNITMLQHMPRLSSTRYEAIDWAAVIDTIFESWQASGYPRCNYITLVPLHRLVICALLVHVLAAVHENNTADYAQLLAHGERLFLEAQQQLASGNLNENHVHEHNRVLGWADGGGVGFADLRDPHLHNLANASRMEWVVELMHRTRGEDPGLPL